jgi:hypothetical protein
VLKRINQLAPTLVGRCAGVLHLVAELVLGLVVLAAVGLAVLSWRLSQGPMQLGWLTHRLEAMANADGGPTHLSIGSAALAWEGFNGGVDRPLDIRFSNLMATGPAGELVAAIPKGAISLSVGWLLLGRLVPRAIDVQGANLRMLRAADGAVTLDLGSLTEGDDTAAAKANRAPEINPFDAALMEMANPPQGDRDDRSRSHLSQLRRLLIENAQLTVVDRQLGATWRSPSARVDLRRGPTGGVAGTADVDLALGAAHARVTVTAEMSPGGAGTHIIARMTAISPAELATAAPGLAMLSAVDAPMTIGYTLDLGRGLTWQHGTLDVQVAAGAAHVGDSTIQISGGTLQAAADPSRFELTRLQLMIPSPHAQPGAAAPSDSIFRLAGHAERGAGGLTGRLSVDLDHLDLGDLRQLWPDTVAKDARNWIVENVTAGAARNGHFELALSTDGDMSNVRVTAATGQLVGEDLTVHWLRPLPPVLHGHAILTLDDPDAITIVTNAGQQKNTAVMLRDGTMHITGLSVHDQVSTLQMDIAGPIADLVSVLRQPSLHLFDRRPIDLRDPSGDAAVKLNLFVPLKNDLQMDQVRIAAHAQVSNAHLTGIAADHDLDRGELGLDITQDGLTVAGTGELAGIPAQISGSLDFRDGPANGIIETVAVSGHTSADHLRAAGLVSGGVLVGPLGLAANYAERRNGTAEVSVQADLAGTAVGVSPLGWRKPPGAPASASFRVLLQGGHVVGMDRLAADGDGLRLRGSADFADGKPNVLKLQQVELGQTAAHGEVQFPLHEGSPIRVALQGPRLDLSARLPAESAIHSAPRGPRPSPADGAAGPPWQLDATFAQTLLAEERPLGGLTAHVISDGRLIREAQIRAGGAERVDFTIMPDAKGRRLELQAGDAGTLLRALGITGSLQGGRLQLTGQFDDSRPTHPLLGTARISGVRVRNAPMVARVLQAMTLYGLVELAQGPGLEISQLVAPFRLEGDMLELQEARAFNSALGVTALGNVDLWQDTADLQGTIVPAYFFNSMLGDIPLVGRLFSPEKGGGLFAASFAIHGSLDDPTVSVNPLSALTPGFLRGVFGLFDKAKPAP